MTPKFNDEVTESLSGKLQEKHVKERDGPKGSRLSYVETHYVIRRLNEVFGFAGWHHEVIYEQIGLHEDDRKKWFAGYVAKARLTVSDDRGLVVYREGLGSGDNSNFNRYQAVEYAIKEAESDALKRAAMKFGDQFGLALYDGDQPNVDRSSSVYEALENKIRSVKTRDELVGVWSTLNSRQKKKFQSLSSEVGRGLK